MRSLATATHQRSQSSTAVAVTLGTLTHVKGLKLLSGVEVPLNEERVQATAEHWGRCAREGASQQRRQLS